MSASLNRSTHVLCQRAAISNSLAADKLISKKLLRLYLEGYLAPTIATKTKHSSDAVERYIRDFESARLLAPKFDDVDTISRIIRLASRVVRQYVELIPSDD